MSLLSRHEADKPGTEPAATTTLRRGTIGDSTDQKPPRERRHSSFSASAPAPSAEEIVASKLSQFGKSRRDLVHALAKHFEVDVPDDVVRFFDAVEGGRFEEIDAAHQALLLGGDVTTPRSAELHQSWRAIP